jgi:hypothetical protein
MLRVGCNVDAVVCSHSAVPRANLSQPLSRKVLLLVRASLAVLFAGVLLVGFLAYLSPAMRLNWETIASMCGL